VIGPLSLVTDGGRSFQASRQGRAGRGITGV
jgi:hypothetical protein